ncbi:ESF1 homolog isoform X2 [Hyperolius riggenbachi]|uniref:ESF1 homolog isoform X2 n=1 Tax=Hyperolius riggenbachi TaxID=752182 RepID=UPI0035A3D153
MSSKKDLASDQRFSRVTRDPRFWEMPEREKKIKIDKRFQGMFKDKKFSLNYTVDKRGRPIHHNTTEDLRRFYDLSDSSDEASAEENESKAKKGKQKAKLKKKTSTEANTASEEGQKEKKKAQAANKTSKDSQNIKVKNIVLSKEKNKSKSPHLEATKKSISTPTKLDSDENSGDEFESGDDGSEMSGLNLDEDEEGSDEESEDEESQEGGSEVEEGENDDDEEEEDEEEDSDSGPDLARGKGNIETSSEEEDNNDDEESDEVDMLEKDTDIEHAWRDLDKDAPRGEEVTRRLAVCNMDWDRLKAKDLLALFNSFKPKGGIVFSVKIYPSEFGKERLKEEELHGPTELKTLTEEDAGEKGVVKEKLREYQFKRLKYFYAVVECDTPETANKIYTECDGLEFESSCSFVDLRFIPDDVKFEDEPKDSAEDVDLSAYKPKFFTSSASVTSKVSLTWDETDQDRVTTLNRPFKKNEILDMDFQAYLASSSEEEEEEEEVPADDVERKDEGKSKKGVKDDEEQIRRYRELLKGIHEKEKKQEEKGVEMEVKWVPGLKESAEQMVRNKLEGKDKLTPWEKYLQKQKDKRKMKKRKKGTVEEKDDDDDEEEDEMPSDVDFNDPYFSEELKKPGMEKKSGAGKKDEEASSEDEEEKERQKAEMALLMMDDVEDDRKHFNYDKIVEQQNLSRSKKKKLKNKEDLVEDEFQINVEDSRFQALYTSHLYNVDPSDPSFKKTKAMERVLEEKARRRETEQKNYTETVKKHEAGLVAAQKAGTSAVKTTDPSLSLLLKSVKSKTQQFQASKRQKTK